MEQLFVVRLFCEQFNNCWLIFDCRNASTVAPFLLNGSVYHMASGSVWNALANTGASEYTSVLSGMMTFCEKAKLNRVQTL